MSRILRRPMFRGGPVSSYGTGIASGLADGGRVKYAEGDLVTETTTEKPGFFKSIINALNPTSGEVIERMQKVQEAPSLGEKLFSPSGAPLEFRTKEDAEEYLIKNPNYKGEIKILESGEILNQKITDTSTNTETNTDVKGKGGDGTGLNTFQEKSDKEVMQEYMDMFKESLGGDKEELNRQRFLEIAKFGANLLAQPGGQSLGEAVGKAGAPALEGFSKIEAAERAADRQAKTLGFQAALKELDGGAISKNVRDLIKLGKSKDEAIKIATQNASAGSNRINNIKIINDALQQETTPGIALKVSTYVVDNEIPPSSLSKHPDPTKTTGSEVKGRYYYFEKEGPGGEFIGKWDGEKFLVPGDKGFK